MSPSFHLKISHLHAGTKLTGLAAIIILSFAFTHPFPQALILGLLLLLYFKLELRLNQLQNMIGPLLPFLVLIGLLTGFFHGTDSFYNPSSQDILFPQSGIGLSQGGVFLGLTYSLRIVIMITGTIILTGTTTLEDFMDLFKKLNLPDGLRFALITGLRFIPALNRRRLQIMEAQRARGAKLNTKGLIAPLKAHIPIMIPLMINSMLMAETLSMAMLNRGYGYSAGKRGRERGRDFALTDKVLMLLCLAIVGIGLYVRAVLHWGAL